MIARLLTLDALALAVVVVMAVGVMLLVRRAWRQQDELDEWMRQNLGEEREK